MPGFNPENVNIHDLTVEEPEKQEVLPFDPEMDITERDWEEMRVCLDRARKQYSRGGILDPYEVAGNMKILNADFEVNFSLEESEKIKKRLKGSLRLERIKAAVSLKILNTSFGIDFNSNDWQASRESLKRSRSASEWSSFLLEAQREKILNPAIDLELTPENWQEIKNAIEIQRKKSLEDEKVNIYDYQRFSRLGSAMRVIDPGGDLVVNQSDWETMKQKLDFYREQNNYHVLAELAADMKILAAEKVEVTDEGLEITMPEKKVNLGPATSDTPEQRKF